MKKFEVGKTYYYRFACSYDTVVNCKVIKRTAKTITFTEDNDSEPKTRRIYEFCGSENVAVDHYSMAPTLSADRESKEVA